MSVTICVSGISQAFLSFMNVSLEIMFYRVVFAMVKCILIMNIKYYHIRLFCDCYVKLWRFNVGGEVKHFHAKCRLFP